jgi:hypothetical protein
MVHVSVATRQRQIFKKKFQQIWFNGTKEEEQKPDPDLQVVSGFSF